MFIAEVKFPEDREMKSIYFMKTVGGFVLGISLLLGIGIMSSTTAQAQYPTQDPYWRNQDRNRDRNRRDDWWNRNRRGRYNDGYPDLGGSFDLRQTALNAGFNDGVKEGRKDRGNGERYDFRDESGYQKATRDYSSRLGDRWIYQRYYREAFEHGYADGYEGY
jgi:hypothetical protein